IMAEFGFKALQNTPLSELLNEACAETLNGLGVEHAKVLQYRPATDDLLIASGIGWAENVVGHVTLSSALNSPPGRAFRTGKPVYIEDIRKAQEFEYSDVLREHGVVALVNVPIRTAEFTFGVLEADSDQPRQFTDDDHNFLNGFANLIAAAVQKCQADAERDLLVGELTEALRLAEAALESNKRLLAATGHDLMQPVQVIQLSLDQLAKRVSDPEARRLLSRSRTATSRLRRDLDQLLALRRMERSAFDPHIEKVRLGPLLTGLVEEFRSVADVKGLSLCCVPSRRQGLTDAHLLEHILRNLISNAIKYTKTGRILAGCRRRGDSIDIEVHDTGIGIATADVEQIFKEYHRLDPEHGQGLGLGLSIVKQMADLLGHQLTVRSREGHGTCFRVSVPRA
ncbi:MAG: GAF domain-containing sensor histidine kinase, partial [Alphaproteobacteria bacterium]|nr:GAF domain-containing sensor histidine kinase [Alphaproteobacteria bacterium]